MSKLKKSVLQDNSQDSQSIQKYLTFEEKQTEIPEPIADSNHSNNQSDKYSPHPKNKRQSVKKVNRSRKKQISNSEKEQIGKPVQKLSKRKSKAKKKAQLQNSSEHEIQIEKENQKDSNSLSIKIEKPIEKRQKSQRLSRKKAKLDAQTNKNSDDENQDKFQDKKLNQENVRIDSKNFNQDDSQKIRSNQDSQNSFSINFNKRLKKNNKEAKKLEFDAIFSGYAEDQTSVNHGSRPRENESSYKKPYESDLADLQFFERKKQKKTKKQPEPKIKNKFFKDIAISCDSSTPQEENSYEGQDPPEDCQELIIEKKGPRKSIFNRKQQIQQKAKQAKDKRDMKSGEHDIKVKNQLKSTMWQVKDLDQFNVCVEDPLLATKKGVSGALLIKNAIQKQEKGGKSTQQTTQKTTQNSSDKPLTLLQKTSSNTNIKLHKSDSMTEKELIKQQQFDLQMKKKGVKREDFEKHIVNQIKTKRVTLHTSQEVMDNVKSTSLDDFDMDGDFTDDLLSNCSNQSGSRTGLRYDRRMSVESQKSRKSNAGSEKSQKSIQGKDQKSDSSNQICENNHSVNRSRSSWNVEMVQTNSIDQNQNSVSFVTNKLPRNFAPLKNLPISQAKQSEISSSLPPASNSHLFKSNFRDRNQNLNNSNSNFQGENNQNFEESLKQQVKKAFPETSQLFESQNEQFIDKTTNKGSKLNQNGEKTFQELIEKQEESDKKLLKKLKKMTKRKNQISNGVDQLLDDNEYEKKSNRKPKHKNKTKKSKLSKNSIDTFFQEQAEYSSSEQGHTDDQQQANQQDLDINGNIKGLLDEDSNVQLNEALVRKKFLKDQEELQQKELDRLIKAVHGKRKPEESESEIKMRMRMEEAARKRKLQEMLDNDVLIDGPQQKIEIIFESPVNETEHEEKNLKKLQELEKELLYGDKRHHLSEDSLIAISRTVNPFEMLNVELPEQRNHRVSVLQFSGFKNRIENRGKSGEHKKSLLDLKKSNVQQEIHKKTVVDHKRGQSTGNRNKIQKITGLDLGIRSKNTNSEEDVEI